MKRDDNQRFNYGTQLFITFANFAETYKLK